MKLLFIMLTSLLAQTACASNPGPLGEKTIDISNFDFSTPISTILPDRYIDPNYEGCYQIPQPGYDDTNLMQSDTVLSWDTNEPLWIEYRYGSTSTVDEYIRFEEQIFNAANFITTLEGRIVVVSGYVRTISSAESDALIERITKKYGEPKITSESFCRKDYDLYTWVLEDRTIKYAPITTDESNVLKLEIERNEQGELTDMREGKRETRLQGYIYIFDGPWAEKVCEGGGEASGDFVYCN